MEELSKKIFITGISGFTGKHLEKYLAENGYEVHGSVLTVDSNENHHVCNLLDEKSISKVLAKVKPDYIIHLAAISFVASKDQRRIYDVNVFGTLNLLKCINELNYIPNKILIASSAAVYGNIEGVLDESICPKPVNHYGNSKLVMEHMTKQYFETQNIIIVRPFNYTGLWQEDHFLIPKIVSHFKHKKGIIELGNIEVYREFNDVEYVVSCYSDLIISDSKSNILNVCTGKEYNIRYILEQMKDISGYEIDVEINPKFVRKNEIGVLKGSPEKLFSIIGDKSNKFSLNNTLLDMYTDIAYLN